MKTNRFDQYHGSAIDCIIASPTEYFQLNSENKAKFACPSCGSERINLVKMSNGCRHYAAKRCGRCDRFLGWQQNPANQQKREQQIEVIANLLQSPHLSKWEQQFLSSIGSQKIHTPKQSECLAKIESKIGGAAS